MKLYSALRVGGATQVEKHPRLVPSSPLFPTSAVASPERLWLPEPYAASVLTRHVARRCGVESCVCWSFSDWDSAHLPQTGEGLAVALPNT
jgi:hypothetical protein